jgi:hypothetical protein
MPMTPEAILALQQIMEHCHAKWEDANRPTKAPWPTPDMLTGKKMAYNDVLQYARTLLGEKP